MRKLASIQKIKEIRPIPGADAIEVARVLGWDVVVKKDEFRTGEDVIYVEIDAFLPIEPEFEFLRSSSYKNSPLLGEGFRLKTVKLRGQISQGLILPVAMVEAKGWIGLPEGTDVSEILGIRKWEEPEPAGLGGDVKGRRPEWIEKSDETRIQSAPELLQAFAGLEYYITTKYDGSSHFIAIDEEDHFRFGSHNMELKSSPDQPFYRWLTDRNIPERLLSIKKLFQADRIYVIGEWCGQGIQSNKIGLKRPCWYPFTANVDGRRLSRDDLDSLCALLEVAPVAVEEKGFDLPSVYPTIDALLARATENKAKVYPGQPEGIVIRPTSSYYKPKIDTPNGTIEGLEQILSMKVINNKYLLKAK